MGPIDVRRPFTLLPLVILVCSWFHPVLNAQSSEQRQRLKEWEERLSAITDAEVLLQLLDSAAADGGRAMVQLRRGLVERRLGLVTHNRRYFDDALDDFWAAAEQEDWPYPWYGLGTTKLAMAEERLLPYPAPHQPPGSGYAEEAGVALDRAVEIDPKFEAAAAAFQVAAADSTGAGSEALLGLARLQRESGNRDSAIALYRDYLRIAPDSGVALLELAPLLAGSNRLTDAVEVYYRGASRIASPQARTELRANVAWVADSAELREFDRLPPEKLRGWLEEFWERRDVRDTRGPGERLAEHLRRLDYAEREFRRVSDDPRHTPRQRYQSDQTRLDDRAVIYIRHGEPDDRAAFASAFASNDVPTPEANDPDQAAAPPPNVSWKYRRSEGNLIFHFVSHMGSDYKLIESLFDVFSLDTVIALQVRLGCRSGRFYSIRDMHRVQPCPEDLEGPQPAGPGNDAVRFVRPLIASRSELDPVYARMATSSLTSGSANFQREREAGQRSIAVGTTSDSYVQRFGNDLEPMIQTYGVSREGAGKILLVFGIPRRRLGKADINLENGFPITVRLVLSSREDRRLVQVDTVTRLVAEGTLGKDGYLAGYLELPAPSGLHRARVLVVDQPGDAGGIAQIEEVAVPPTAPEALSVSDLILGKEGRLSWPGPDGSVPLNPIGVFAPGSAVSLSYQVSGLVVGAAYRTRIAIRSTRSHEGEGRTASAFAEVAREVKQSEQRDLALTGVRPGEYILTLTLTGPQGSMSRSTRLRVK